MTREQARSIINSKLLTDYFNLNTSKSGFVCPVCGSGTGKNKTGALHLDTKTRRVICFACPEGEGLGKPGQDTLGALRVLWGCSEAEVFARVGIQIDGFTSSSVRSMPMRSEPAQPIRPAQDFSEYYARCRERLREPAAISYLQARGISVETAEAYNIGYDAESDAACSGHKARRIILPTSSAHYVARAIDSSIPAAFQKLNVKGAKPSIFNLNAIYAGADAVFVCEGHFDALSLLEIGAQAIALCSANNTDLLLQALKNKRTESTLILCLDDDAAGKKATEKLENDLKRLNISYIIGDVTNGHKDANEALCADRTAFTEAVSRVMRKASLPPDAVCSYIHDAMRRDMEIYREVQNRKTGFPDLDKKLRGVFPGLYIVGAASSIGKSTFCWQLADQLAESGENVLFFALEMSRLEMVCKSIARTAAQIDITQTVDSLSLRRGYFPEFAMKAMSEYEKKVGDRISVVESNFCDFAFIQKKIEEYMKRTGKKPIIIIDYLQILEPEKDDRGRTMSTKESVDSIMVKLKLLSRQHSLTVIAISSLNRASYYTPIDFDSFKETGSIEYGCDVLIGLQLAVMSDSIFDSGANQKVKEKKEKLFAARNANPREIEVKVMKNRYGTQCKRYFLYYPHCDLFIEDSAKNKEIDEIARQLRKKES